MKASLHNRLRETVFTAFREANMLEQSSLLLVSGGVDSMTLLALMMDLVTARRLKPFEVLHFNYNLRSDANLDAELVTKVCSKFNIPLTVQTESLRAKQEQRSETMNIQAVARKLRYSVGRKLLREKKLCGLVMAHHADDQVETFLWKLGEDKSLSALCAPKHLSRQVLRPLLTVWKSELYACANAEGVLYREDSSNHEATYLRNAIRHHVLAGLKETLPNFKQAVLEFQYRLGNLLSLQEKLLVDAGIAVQVAEMILLEARFFRLETTHARQAQTTQTLRKQQTLSMAEKLQLLHGLFLKSYPKRRFSKGEILEIFKKLGTGQGRKELFYMKPYGRVVSSRGLIAPLPIEASTRPAAEVCLRINSRWKQIGRYGSLMLVDEARYMSSLGQTRVAVEPVTSSPCRVVETFSVVENINKQQGINKHYVVPEFVFSRLYEEMFKVRGHEKLGTLLLKNLKTPYQLRLDSWEVKLEWVSTPPVEGVTMPVQKMEKNNNPPLHIETTVPTTKIATPSSTIKVGVCSPFGLFLASQELFSHRFKSSFLFYDDEWMAWKQQQHKKLQETQRLTNWYLIWKPVS